MPVPKKWRLSAIDRFFTDTQTPVQASRRESRALHTDDSAVENEKARSPQLKHAASNTARPSTHMDSLPNP